MYILSWAREYDNTPRLFVHVPRLILTATLRGRYYYLHFTEEEPKVGNYFMPQMVITLRSILDIQVLFSHLKFSGSCESRCEDPDMSLGCTASTASALWLTHLSKTRLQLLCGFHASR